MIGANVLDIGSGYGSFVNYLKNNGYNAVGIEFYNESFDISKRLFPNIDVKNIDLKLFVSDKKFDTVVLKDCFHHLYDEDDIEVIFEKIKSIIKPNGRIIIWDPNPNLLLKFCRILAHHKDPEAPAEIVKKILVHHHFKIREIIYYETIGLPLSGGYVGLCMVPNIKSLNILVSRLNSLLSSLAFRLGLEKLVCWRYLIVAELDD